MNEEQRNAIREETRRNLAESVKLTDLELPTVREDPLTAWRRNMPEPEARPAPARERTLDTVPTALIAFVEARIAAVVAEQRNALVEALGESVGELVDELEEQLTKLFEEKIGELRAELTVQRAAAKHDMLELPPFLPQLRRVG